jgi:hypothetical protein
MKIYKISTRVKHYKITMAGPLWQERTIQHRSTKGFPNCNAIPWFSQPIMVPARQDAAIPQLKQHSSQQNTCN